MLILGNNDQTLYCLVLIILWSSNRTLASTHTNSTLTARGVLDKIPINNMYQPPELFPPSSHADIAGRDPPITSYPYRSNPLRKLRLQGKWDSERQKRLSPETRDCQGLSLSLEWEIKKYSEYIWISQCTRHTFHLALIPFIRVLRSLIISHQPEKQK